MTTSADKIAKIRRLAAEGATEGEREAAREALRRIDSARTAEAAVNEAFSHRPRAYDRARKEWLTESEIDEIIFATFGHSFEQSTAPHHHGRVWFDRS